MERQDTDSSLHSMSVVVVTQMFSKHDKNSNIRDGKNLTKANIKKMRETFKEQIFSLGQRFMREH